jgi:SAM-dependent methyltransferase
MHGTPLSATIDNERQDLYARMLAEDGHDNVPGFLHDAAHLYDGVSIAGRTVLEIGSGRGLMSIYTALRGAATVVSMEPELVGSRNGMIELQRQRLDALGVHNVELLGADFNAWNPGSRRFDLVLSRASINHLFPATRNASADPGTFAGYVDVAARMRALLDPGGIALVTDASRYAFFTAVRDLGIRRPWNRVRTGVDWRHHQNPSAWAGIFRAAGFSAVTIRYPLPYRLRRLKGVVDTAPVNFFLKGSFILKAVR